MHCSSFCPLALALLSILPGSQASGLYTSKSPVLNIDSKDYGQLITKSNRTSIVEFYAPWCGHCRNLKPAYEKAAEHLEGIAKVAAVNCDDKDNEQFCGLMGVKGFPTLKIIRPSKDGKGEPSLEDYQGPRTASGIVKAVGEHINNHVKRVTDKNIGAFLEENKETPKALVFSEKTVIPNKIKSVAIDFLGVITIGYVQSKEIETVEKYGIESFPTVVLLLGGDQEPIKYDGEPERQAIIGFLSQAGSPNPDPAPPSAAKAGGQAKDKGTPSAASDFSKHAQIKPVILDQALPIPAIHRAEKLRKECFGEKSPACVLAIVPEGRDDKATQVLDALSEIAYKHSKSQRPLFPIFELPQGQEVTTTITKALGLEGDVGLVAVNSRRGWWRRYQDEGVSRASIEAWIDTIRMNEGSREKLPESIRDSLATDDAHQSEEYMAAQATGEASAGEPEAAESSVKHEEL